MIFTFQSFGQSFFFIVQQDNFMPLEAWWKQTCSGFMDYNGKISIEFKNKKAQQTHWLPFSQNNEEITRAPSKSFRSFSRTFSQRCLNLELFKNSENLQPLHLVQYNHSFIYFPPCRELFLIYVNSSLELPIRPMQFPTKGHPCSFSLKSQPQSSLTSSIGFEAGNCTLYSMVTFDIQSAFLFFFLFHIIAFQIPSKTTAECKWIDLFQFLS